MKRFMKKLVKSAILMVFVGLAFAENDVEVDGQSRQTTLVPNHPQIQLLKLKISQQGQHKLRHRLMAQRLSAQHPFKPKTSNLPRQVELGMNNLPVLDQGRFGTCVTFAVTAALDAISQKGDYISQLCSLSLSQYLSQHSHMSGMWMGTMPTDVFNLISIFGIINKENEKTYGCGGYHSYPMNDIGSLPEMDIDSFYQHSEEQKSIAYYFTNNYLNAARLLEREEETEQELQETKAAIHHGDRVVLAMMLIADRNVGAYGKHHQNHDTWVISEHVFHSLSDENLINTPLAGHAMVITGYDDNAEAIDDEGKVHRGLFTLRNSWGPKAGDQGNYYISYDYFKLLTFDLTQIKINPFHFE